MKKSAIIVFVIILIAVYFVFKEFYYKNTNSNHIPLLAAPVTVTKAAYGKLRKKVVIYGKVIANVNGIKNIVLSFDSVIDDIYVATGQNVNKGQLLLNVSPTKYAEMRLRQAQNLLKTAKRNLYFVEQRYNVRIATKQDLLNARNAYSNALIQYSILKKSLKSNISSPINGVVNKIFYIKGSSAPAQSPIIQVINKHELIIRCGIEMEYLKYIHRGLVVHISIIGNAKKQISGKIIKIAGIVNPNTNLVNVYIKPIYSKTPLLFGNLVKVIIYANERKGILIPEQSVLQEGDKYFIYVIKNNIAYKRYVRLLLKTDIYDLIKGNIKRGDLVVSLGNYELKQGMTVIINNRKS
ncbi:MAG: efflux RND transporter periplasmic adaptor subunit [Deltaproteobacteria bacterium]|nr:efflux RND transporter periplasmic adaptor subunit [Deltaproteobacteria bacterium]